MNVRSRSCGNRLVVSALFAGLVFAAAGTSEAVLITITNTSSSYYSLRDGIFGFEIANNTVREGVSTYDLPDVGSATNSNWYSVIPGQVADQGVHYFRVIGGQIVFPSGNPASAFFTNNSPTSLTIGSIPVHFRLLLGADNTLLFDPYFAPQSMTVGTDRIVNLTPTDGAGFIGNWKNTFPYAFAQRTPFQLGPVGIQSMTDSAGTGTIVPSSIVSTNFVEGGIGYNGFRFTLANGSEWLYFTVPEPSVLAFCSLGGAAALLAYRRKNASK